MFRAPKYEILLIFLTCDELDYVFYFQILNIYTGWVRIFSVGHYYDV